MKIEISVERERPPSGVVAVDGGPDRRFDGWLGLLRLASSSSAPDQRLHIPDRTGIRRVRARCGAR